MAIEGNLATLSFADLVQLLASTRKTGTLHITEGRDWKKLYFRDGLLLATASSDTADSVGRALVNMGKIGEPDLREALERRKTENKLLGQILVDLGKLQPETLHRYLRDKAYDLVDKLQSTRNAGFRFEEFALPAAAGGSLDMTAEELLMEGFRRTDEVSRYREMLPSEEMVLEKTGYEPQGDDLMSQTLVGLVVKKLEAPKSVRSLKREIKTSEFSLLDGLAKLLEKGVLRIKPREPAPPAPANWFEDSRKFIMAGLFEPAVELLRLGLAHEPGNARAKEMLARAESSFAQEVTRRDLPLEAVPLSTTSLEALIDVDLVPAEAFLLSRIDGEATVAGLVESTPLPPAETLRTLRRLLRRGHIKLK